MAYAVIRVRGQPDVNRDIEFTMGLLGLNRVNHCVVVPENASTKGMLQVIKDYCTWGEVNQETLAAMIRLHPPVKGYEGNKRSYQNGGALGYRGEAINDLINRML